jgi:uncharacterized phage protein (TIGR01671 family)
MTKEIKFRAWNIKNKSMIDEVLEMGFGCRHYPETWLIGDDQRTDHFELMQYTGLKDKNGKEIYENDLLQYDGYNFKLINKEKIYQVRYDDNLAQYYAYNLENSFDTFLVVRAWKESKIIGNIYQNPELLWG